MSVAIDTHLRCANRSSRFVSAILPKWRFFGDMADQYTQWVENPDITKWSWHSRFRYYWRK
jgi:hypothetical protein